MHIVTLCKKINAETSPASFANLDGNTGFSLSIEKHIVKQTFYVMFNLCI